MKIPKMYNTPFTNTKTYAILSITIIIIRSVYATYSTDK